MIRMPGDYSPITWWGKVPVYVTTYIVIAYCAGMVFSVLARALGYTTLLDTLLFSTYAVTQQFKLWQTVSYAFVSPISFWFLVEMLMVYFFGIEVERFLGRKNYILLFVLLIFAPPIFLTVGSLLGQERVYFGSSAINLAIFIAFILINPNAEIFFGIRAKWVGLVILALNSLMAVSTTDWTGLSVLWLECAVVVIALRRMGVRSLQLAFPRLPAVPLKRVVKKQSAGGQEGQGHGKASAAGAASEGDLVESIDPILDKIAQEGIGSLTHAEKEQLERARKALLKRKIDSK